MIGLNNNEFFSKPDAPLYFFTTSITLFSKDLCQRD